MRSENDPVRLVQGGASGSVESGAPVSVRVVRQSNAPWRLVLKVRRGMTRGYTFCGLALHIGISHERLRLIIHEVALEIRAERFEV